MRESTRVAEQKPPYESYAAIMAVFGGLLATAGLLSRKAERGPQCNTWLDLTLLAAATFKAARTLARDPVTAPIRAPFVEGDAHDGDEPPISDGSAQQAIGELVTCTRCIGTWVAAGLARTQVATPRFGRVLTLALGTAGINDFLQASFVALNHKSDELKRRAGD